MLSIIRGVPIPDVARPKAPQRRKYPFEELEVGEMFFAPDKTRSGLATHVSAVGKKLGRKFSARKTFMRVVKGQWAPCEEGDPGAVAGVGVWRKA